MLGAVNYARVSTKTLSFGQGGRSTRRDSGYLSYLSDHPRPEMHRRALTVKLFKIPNISIEKTVLGIILSLPLSVFHPSL